MTRPPIPLGLFPPGEVYQAPYVVLPTPKRAPKESPRPELSPPTPELSPFATNPVFEMVMEYGPTCKFIVNAVKVEAWVGDRLLAAAIGLIIVDELKLGRDARHQACYSNANAHLSGFLPRDHHAFPGMFPHGEHARGTVVEAALCRLYRAKGIAAVIKVCLPIVERALKPQRVRHKLTSGPSRPFSPEAIPIVAPSSLHTSMPPTQLECLLFRPTRLDTIPTLPDPALSMVRSTLRTPPPQFRESILCPTSGAPIGYVSVDGQRVMYGEQWRALTEPSA